MSSLCRTFAWLMHVSCALRRVFLHCQPWTNHRATPVRSMCGLSRFSLQICYCRFPLHVLHLENAQVVLAMQSIGLGWQGCMSRTRLRSMLGRDQWSSMQTEGSLFDDSLLQRAFLISAKVTWLSALHALQISYISSHFAVSLDMFPWGGMMSASIFFFFSGLKGEISTMQATSQSQEWCASRHLNRSVGSETKKYKIIQVSFWAGEVFLL